MTTDTRRARASLATSLCFLAGGVVAGGAVAAPALAAPFAFTAQGEDRPDERPEIEELLDQLREHAKKRGDEDTEAVAVIDQLVQEFPECGPKDREDIVDGLGDVFKEKRGESAEGVPDNKLYLAAAIALGEMGPESADALEDWIDHKKHRKDVALQRRLILSLGKTGNPDGLGTLEDLLTHREATLQAAAAEALGNFTGQELDVRKDLFEAVLKQLMSVKNARDADPNDVTARERYDVISAPMITTLQRLSGHDERDPQEWQRWWNKNKKEDWDQRAG